MTASKIAHHMWKTERNPEGKTVISRSKEEQNWDSEDWKYAKDVSDAVWGLWGAEAISNPIFVEVMPKSVARKYVATAQKFQAEGVEAPKVRTWEELKAAFGAERVAEIKRAVAKGMQIRKASVELELPFLVASRVMYAIEDEQIDLAKIKSIIALVKEGKIVKAASEYGSLAGKISSIYHKAMKFSDHKIALDDSAKKYYEDYWGPYGESLTKEVKKRIRADLAFDWLKRAVDEAAAKYWQNYFSEEDYGKMLTEYTPPSRKPAS
jgi:hypothetical protein